MNCIGSESVIEVLEKFHVFLVALGTSSSIQQNNLCIVVFSNHVRNSVDVKNYLYGHSQNLGVSLELFNRCNPVCVAGEQ